jgi:Tol biopolymer transport system component
MTARRILLATALALAAAAPPAAAAELAVTTQCGFRQGQVDLLARDGSVERQLLECGYGPGSVSWTPDGASLLFESAASRIAVTDGDRGSATELVEGYAPAFAPDGERFAFVRNRAIRLAAADGSGQRLLRAREGGAGSLHWSPDGSAIVFRATYHNVRLIDAENGELLRQVAGASYYPAGFSPDGERILLVRACAKECRFGLYTARVDGGRPERLPESPRQFIQDAAWSPDGRRIAAVIQSPPRDGFVRSRVVLLSPSGSHQRVVLRSPRYKPRARNVTGVPSAVAWRP